jgi:hypothetical protein
MYLHVVIKLELTILCKSCTFLGPPEKKRKFMIVTFLVLPQEAMHVMLQVYAENIF